MYMVRWNPFHELDGVERRMRRLFDDLGIVAAPLPAADAYETESEYVLELEVPGFAKDELAVEVTDHTLVVKGARAETEEKVDDRTFHVHERLAHEFERRFRLPLLTSEGRVTADFDAGVLTVRAEKVAVPTPQKVPIG